MQNEKIIIELLERIYEEVYAIREYVTRDKLAELEEQAELTKRYTIKQETLNRLGVSYLRDGKLDPTEVLEAADKLDMDPKDLEKEVQEFIIKQQKIGL